ncbi:MAG: hypothetical protein P8Y05_06425 [Deinococcales bacterium]
MTMYTVGSLELGARSSARYTADGNAVQLNVVPGLTFVADDAGAVGTAGAGRVMVAVVPGPEASRQACVTRPAALLALAVMP